jgi:hypothetical protein
MSPTSCQTAPPRIWSADNTQMNIVLQPFF